MINPNLTAAANPFTSTTTKLTINSNGLVTGANAVVNPSAFTSVVQRRVLTTEQKEAILEQIGKLAAAGFDEESKSLREMWMIIDEQEREIRSREDTIQLMREANERAARVPNQAYPSMPAYPTYPVYTTPTTPTTPTYPPSWPYTTAVGTTVPHSVRADDKWWLAQKGSISAATKTFEDDVGT